MDSKRIRQTDEELMKATDALDAAKHRLDTAYKDANDALNIEYPIRTILSFDRSKDQNWDKAAELGLNDGGGDSGAARNFVYEVLNLSVEVEVGEGGNVTILSVNGVELDDPIEA